MAVKKTYKIDTGDIAISDLDPIAQDVWNGLTDKARAVVAAYCRTGSTSRAYIEGTGYTGSVTNAGHMARKIIKLPKVKIIVEAWRKAGAERLGISEDKVLRTYGHLAFADIRDFFDEHGKMKEIKDLPRECADMISGFEVEELYDGQGKERTQVGWTKKVKLISRKDALDSISRTMGLFISEPKVKNPEAKVVKMPTKPVSADKWLEKNKPQSA